VVRKRKSTIFEIQLGFLQQNHTYEVNVDLASGLDDIANVEKYGQSEVPPPIHCKFINIDTSEGKSVLKFQFKAIHDRVTKEKIELLGPDDSSLQFDVTARVLGKGKGTPMLRSGIHCIGIEDTDETEDTDWRGF